MQDYVRAFAIYPYSSRISLAIDPSIYIRARARVPGNADEANGGACAIYAPVNLLALALSLYIYVCSRIYICVPTRMGICPPVNYISCAQLREKERTG